MNEALLFFLRTFTLEASPSGLRLCCAVALPQRLDALVLHVQSGRADAAIAAFFKAKSAAALAYWRSRVLEALQALRAQNDVLFKKEVERMCAMSDFNDLMTLKVAFEVFVNEGAERLRATMRSVISFEALERETMRRVAHIEALILMRFDVASEMYMRALFEVYRAPGQTLEETLALVFAHLKGRINPSEAYKHIINLAYAKKRHEWLSRAR